MFEEIKDKIESIEDRISALQEELQSLGYELTVFPIGQKPQTTSEGISAAVAKGKKKIGINAYWDAIREIETTQNVSRAEARRLYVTAKATANKAPANEIFGKTTNGTLSDKTLSEKLSKKQRKYWKEIRRIVDEQHLSFDEARAEYKLRQSAARA